MNNVNDNIFYPEGYVVLPLSEYKKLLKQAEKLDDIIVLKKNWTKDSVIAEFNKEAFYEYLVARFTQSRYNVECALEIKKADDFYVSDVEIAKQVAIPAEKE